MPATLKIVYTINPALDLADHDDCTIAEVMHDEYGTTIVESLLSTLNNLLQEGVTSPDLCRIVFDRPNHTMSIERTFTTLAMAESRKTWIESDIPVSTATFTRTVLEINDNTTVTEAGAFTI